jgi:uncharacterized integral membrane protein (TIGR00698 family)
MIARIAIPLGALLCLLPFVSAGEGLLLGLLTAVLFGNPYLDTTKKFTPQLLALSVVGLGAGMDLRVVARAGAHGFLYTIVSISCAIALGALFTRLFSASRNIGALITVGTAICGGSAIAAVVPILRPRDDETSVALGTVFLLNAIALFIFPVIGHAVHLGDTQFGLWAALAIHDTSSVVGAAASWSAEALQIATTVKLARALWIVPLTFAVGLWHGGGKGKPKRPWFIAGFILAAALATYVPALHLPGHYLSLAARQSLVVTLFFIGASLTRSAIRTVGVRPLALGLSLWIAMAALSLAAIATGIIA